MRIVQITSEYPPYMISGLGTHVHQLVQGLSANNCEVFVFAYNPILNSVIRDKNVTVHFISPPDAVEDLRKTLDRRVIETLNDQIVQRARDYFSHSSPPDLIHCHDWPAFSAARALRQTFQSTIVTTVHFLEEWTRGWGEKYQGRDFVEVQSNMFRVSDAIISVSQSMKREIVQTGSVDSNNVHVVYNGIEIEQLDALDADAEEIDTARREYAPNGERIVLFAGRIDYLKGVSSLLVSAARVIEYVGDVIYLIAGEYVPGEYTDFVFSLAQNLPGLKERVKFLGKLPKKRLFQLYRLADLVVVPSVIESFGYVAAEAMVAGATVIASDIGGLSELIEHRKSGVLIPLKKDDKGYYSVDAVKLADAQIELLQDEALKVRLGITGQQFISSRFTLQNMVDATINIYRHLTEACR
jgi:alpha-maltose-1-phosphate synthase